MNQTRRALFDVMTTLVMLGLPLVPIEAVSRAVEPLRDDGWNLADVERQERSYYEGLTATTRRLDGSPSEGREMPERQSFAEGPLAQPVDDMREYVLRAGFQHITRNGLWTTNEQGLRDQPYSWIKPSNTYRVVILGDSIGAGWGIGDGEGFESLLERSLDEGSRREGGPRVESLNFSVPGHAPGQRWEHFLRSGGWETDPDLLIYEATPADLGWDERRLRVLLPRGLGWDALPYQGVLRALGLAPASRSHAQSLSGPLRSVKDSLLESVYRAVVRECRQRGIPSVLLLIPRVGKPADAEQRQRLLSIAERAGFDYILDLSPIFVASNPAELWVRPDDYHPNRKGHEIIARHLEKALVERTPLRAWLRGHSGDLNPHMDAEQE